MRPLAPIVLLLVGCTSDPATQLCSPDCPSQSGGGTQEATGGGSVGPTTLIDETFVGGSRIKAAVLSEEGAPPTRMGFRDTQLDTDCYLQVAGDGVSRCVPWATAYAVDGYFSDASCTRPAFSTAMSNPRFALRYDTSGCETRWRFFNVGAALSSQHWFYKTSTGCYMQTVTTGQQAYELGDQLPPETFVSATVTESTANGVGFDTISFGDGAHGTYGLRLNGSPCYAQHFIDGTNRCAPSSLAWGSNTWADSQCSSAAIVSSTCSAPELGVAGWLATDSCEPAVNLVHLGVSLNKYYAGSSCSGVTPQSTQVVYAAGDPVPPAEFPAAQPALVGTGRLQGTVLTWPSGLRTAGRWVDTQLNEACVWYGTSSTPWRLCAVSTPGLNVGAWFGDHGCTEPLAYSQVASSTCAPKYVATPTNPADLSVPPRVFTVGGRHTGNVYVGTPESCTQTTAPDGFALYDTAGEVPLTELASVTQSLQ